MRICLLMLIAVLANGCASSEDVRQLSEKTAANAIFLDKEVSRLENTVERIASARRASTAQLSQSIAAEMREVALHEELLKRSGDADAVSRLKALTEWLEARDKTLNAAATADDAPVEAQVDNAPSPYLAAAKAHAKLADEKNFKPALVFTARYAKEVAELVEKQIEEAEKSVKAAEKTAGELAAKSPSTDESGSGE